MLDFGKGSYMSENEDDIEKKVNERVGGGDDESGEKITEPELPSVFVEECYRNNVMGDATLFSSICKGRFLFNSNSGNWYSWTEHFWEEDTSTKILAAIGVDVATVYNDRADGLGEDIAQLKKDDKNPEIIKRIKKKRGDINARAFALRGDRARKVLGWVPSVAPKMVVKAEEFDTQHHLLACDNGVINLETGEAHAGDPDDKLTLSISHEWPGLETKPEAFVKSLRCSLEAPHDYSGDKAQYLEDRYNYMHRFIGMAVHGAQNERAFMVLFGKHGWNGKGTLMETLLYVLGDYAAPTEPEVLLDSRGIKEAGKPSPHILAMKGKRIIVASETDDGNRFSASAVKRYSGGDTLSGRNPHDIRPTDFKPTHILFLMTNNLPYTDADDRAFWKRMNLMNFHWSYVDNPSEPFEKPRNPRLEQELRKEASAILAWIVQGYHKYLAEGGLNPPADMMKERESYRFRDDTIGQFVEACCELNPDPAFGATPFKDIKEEFDKWYMENITKKPLSAKKLGSLLGKQYNRIYTKDKLPAYEGIQLKVKCPIPGI